MNTIFQIICDKYTKIPIKIQNIWKTMFNMDYQIIDDNMSYKILDNFDKQYLEAFKSGKGKWKSDLLRFCIMSKYSGIYSDVDLHPTSNLNKLPNIDTISVIGAHSPPTKGITPLPNGEIAIGLIICRTPEPLFIEYINKMTPDVVTKGNPYAINIQSLYSFLCKRWNINKIEPFTEYIDPISKRSWYFLKERKIGKHYKILNKNGDIVIHSQYYNHNNFY
jgi:mannosyltransferase OCH1-like enzyme